MPEITRSRYLVQATWDDVPHLDEKTKRELMDSIPPHLREARTKGIPSMGSGAIYPIPLEDIEVKPFAIPAYWKRGFGFDVGWNRTAAIWGAQDPTDGVIYLYAEHYRGQAEPSVHSSAVKARGQWIRGAIDPASRGRGLRDGEQLFANYEQQGLLLVPAVNAVEAGLFAVWQMLSTGRLRVFSTCMNFKAEYRLYRRDAKGKVVKEFDHIMDATRYLIMTWKEIATLPPIKAIGSSIDAIADATAGY